MPVGRMFIEITVRENYLNWRFTCGRNGESKKNIQLHHSPDLLNDLL